MLLATAPAAAREFCHSKPGPQIETENANGIVFGCGSGTYLVASQRHWR